MIAHVITVIVHVELLVSGIVVQVGILILEPLKGNTYVALFFGFSVILIKYLFGVDIDRLERIKNTTHHKGIVDAWLVNASLPFLLYPKGSLVYLSNDHQTAGLLCGISHPQASFISREVKVLIGGVRIRESGASLGNYSGLILHGGEIQLGQPEWMAELIIQSIFTDDKIVSSTVPAAG